VGYPVHVEAVGMACPVGLTATLACAAIRAGIDRRMEMDYLDNDGEPIVGSHLDSLGWERTRRERWSILLAYALRDLCRNHGLGLIERTPMVLVVPADSNGYQPTNAEIAVDLAARLQIQIDPRQVEVVFADSYGAFWAIAAARQRLVAASQSDARVLVAAADSLIEARVLLRLARARRLITKENSDGVIPGEAAACVLLGTSAKVGHASIVGMGFGNEPGRLDNDVPLRGEGIADAARQALSEAGLAMHDLHFRLSDASGEAYWFKEQVLVISKLLRRNMDEFPLWLAAARLGDVGCAASLCNLLTAVAAWRRGYAPGPRAIAYASAGNGDRAALVLEAGLRK
jgi:3-oxoacyl-[acyl-carrier-protein] synthase-1